jgi:hypothetical protein
MSKGKPLLFLPNLLCGTKLDILLTSYSEKTFLLTWDPFEFKYHKKAAPHNQPIYLARGVWFLNEVIWMNGVGLENAPVYSIYKTPKCFWWPNSSKKYLIFTGNGYTYTCDAGISNQVKYLTVNNVYPFISEEREVLIYSHRSGTSGFDTELNNIRVDVRGFDFYDNFSYLSPNYILADSRGVSPIPIPIKPVVPTDGLGLTGRTGIIGIIEVLQIMEKGDKDLKLIPVKKFDVFEHEIKSLSDHAFIVLQNNSLHLEWKSDFSPFESLGSVYQLEKLEDEVSFRLFPSKLSYSEKKKMAVQLKIPSISTDLSVEVIEFLEGDY